MGIPSRDRAKPETHRQTEGPTYTYTQILGVKEVGGESEALYQCPSPRLTYPLYHWTV